MCPLSNFYPEQHREGKCLIKPQPPEIHWAIQAKLIGSGQGDRARPAPLPPQKKTERPKSFLLWSCCAALPGGELLPSGRGSNLCSCET